MRIAALITPCRDRLVLQSGILLGVSRGSKGFDSALKIGAYSNGLTSCRLEERIRLIDSGSTLLDQHRAGRTPPGPVVFGVNLSLYR